MIVDEIDRPVTHEQARVNLGELLRKFGITCKSFSLRNCSRYKPSVSMRAGPHFIDDQV